MTPSELGRMSGDVCLLLEPAGGSWLDRQLTLNPVVWFLCAYVIRLTCLPGGWGKGLGVSAFTAFFG